MEPGFVALLIAMAIVVGVVLGIVMERHKKQNKDSKGILFVNCSEPEYEPSLFLNATVPIREIVSEKQVLFDVNVIR